MNTKANFIQPIQVKICFDNYTIAFKWVEDLTLILCVELIRFGCKRHIHESLAGNPDIYTKRIMK